jgi:hypothetical protein
MVPAHIRNDGERVEQGLSGGLRTLGHGRRLPALNIARKPRTAITGEAYDEDTTFRVTPATEAGLTDHVWSVQDVVSLADFQAPARLTAYCISLALMYLRNRSGWFTPWELALGYLP